MIRRHYSLDRSGDERSLNYTSKLMYERHSWICTALYEAERELDHDTWGASSYVRKTCRFAEHIATEDPWRSPHSWQLPMAIDWLQ
jgi:hypothetical protein